MSKALHYLVTWQKPVITVTNQGGNMGDREEMKIYRNTNFFGQYEGKITRLR
jgi:hypothetical protein